MTKKNAIFQKKLEELETQLKEILSLPEDNPTRQLVSIEFEQSLVFVKNLLYAEISSHPTTNKSHHFQHFHHQLEHMEAAFRGWDSNFNLSMPHHNTDDHSSCSCTDSCFNDDDDDGDGDVDCPVYVDPESVVRDGFADQDKALVEYKGRLVEDKEEPVEFLDCLVEEKVHKKKFRIQGHDEKAGVKSAGNGIGSLLLCKAVTIGIVFGMCLMGWIMVKFSGCFQFEKIEHFPSLT